MRPGRWCCGRQSLVMDNVDGSERHGLDAAFLKPHASRVIYTTLGVGLARQVADPAELVFGEEAADGLCGGWVVVEIRGGDVVQEGEPFDGSHAAVVEDLQALQLTGCDGPCLASVEEN